MKIILTQSEISDIVQQALVDYVSQKLVISEGTEIQVTLANDGAIIDLVASSEPAKPQAKKAAPAAKAETPKAETNVKPFGRGTKTIQAPVVEEAVTETTTDDSVPFEVNEAAAVAPVEATSEITEEPEAAPAAEEAAPPVRSLFANLRKPVN